MRLTSISTIKQRRICLFDVQALHAFSSYRAFANNYGLEEAAFIAYHIAHKMFHLRPWPTAHIPCSAGLGKSLLYFEGYLYVHLTAAF